MQRIHLGRFILVIVVGLTGLTGSSVLGASFTGLYERSVRLTPLIPQQSCYYESYNKRLACVCKSMIINIGAIIEHHNSACMVMIEHDYD